MKRCLISGASGLIGRQLARVLVAKGLFVRGFARNPGNEDLACHEFLQADIRDSASLAVVTTGMDTLFHLAGPAQANDDDPHRQRQLHVEGSLNLLGAARAGGIRRIVYFSSVKAIAPGSSAYGQAKLDAEHAIRVMLAETGMTGIILRPAAVYGPGSKGMLASLLRAVDRGYMPRLPDSDNRRSLVHVEDLAYAAYLAAKNTSSECPAYTITDGQTYSARQIQQLMSSALGKTDTPPSLPMWAWKTMALAGDGLHRLTRVTMPFNSEILGRLLESAEYSDDQARQVLNFEPRYTLQSALPEMIAHYRNKGL